MTLFDYLVLLLTGLLTIVIMSLSFGKISNLESKFNYKYLLFLLIGSFIIVYNAYNNESTLKIIIVLLILIFSSINDAKKGILVQDNFTVIIFFIV